MLTFRDGRPQPLHVSVAHGGGLAAAAVCDHGPIGVDVEHVDARRNLLAIARRFFAPEEHAQLERCGSDERTALFHQWWTRKEAVLKATGIGLRGGLTVRVDGPADRDGWRPCALDGHDAPLFVRDLRTPDVGVFGAIAIEGQPGVVQIGRHTTVEERCRLMDPTAGLMGGANPFAALTFIAAPALLTNASSLLLLGTTNRLARAVDRVRALAVATRAPRRTESTLAQIELRLMALAEQRVRIIVRAMTAFYLAVGSFAFGTMLALVGAALVTPAHDVHAHLGAAPDHRRLRHRRRGDHVGLAVAGLREPASRSAS